MFHEFELDFMRLRRDTRRLLEQIWRELPIRVLRLNKHRAIDFTRDPMHQLNFIGTPPESVVRTIGLDLVEYSLAILVKSLVPTPAKVLV